MKFVMYLRKSRADMQAEAKGEGETLVRHERILLEVAKRNKIVISDIYREIVSGETIASRPVMQRLLSEVEQGMWDGVLVVEVERLARGDTIDQGIVSQAFKLSNTKIITPTKTYDPNNEFDEEYFEFGLFMSRREFKTINRRLQQGRVSSIREGKYLGSVPPYGYLRQKLEKEKGYTLIPHPEQAPIVKMIFDLYVHGENNKRLGVCKIVKKLNSLKIKSQLGKWNKSTIQVMIRNPVYCGKIRWNFRPQIKKVIDGQIVQSRSRNYEKVIVIDGIHPPLVDIETYETANYYIDRNIPTPAPQAYAIKNPLAGLIKCEKCGHNMARKSFPAERKADYLFCPHANCDNISSPLAEVEEMVLTQLEEWYGRIQLEESGNQTAPINFDFLTKSIESIETEMKTLKEQKEKLHDLLEQGIYDTNTFLDRANKISIKIDELKRSREQIESEIEIIKANEESKKRIEPTLEYIIESYQSIQDAEQKNRLLKQVIEKVNYLKEGKNTKKDHSNPVIITLYPKLTK